MSYPTHQYKTHLLIFSIVLNSNSELLQIIRCIQFGTNKCGLICSEVIRCCCHSLYLETFSLHMECSTSLRQLFSPLFNSCFVLLYYSLIDIMWRLCLSARLNNMTPVIGMLSSLYFLQFSHKYTIHHLNTLCQHTSLFFLILCFHYLCLSHFISLRQLWLYRR